MGRPFISNHFKSEQLFFEKLHNTKLTILRLFYPYGFYFENNSTSLMSKIIYRLKKGLIISIPQSNRISPFFIDDLSNIIFFFIKNNITGLFNVAGPEEIQFDEYIRLISKSINCEPQTKENNSITSPVSPDIKKLKTFIPKDLLTDFKTGLKKTILRKKYE